MLFEFHLIGGVLGLVRTTTDLHRRLRSPSSLLLAHILHLLTASFVESPLNTDVQLFEIGKGAGGDGFTRSSPADLKCVLYGTAVGVDIIVVVLWRA